MLARPSPGAAVAIVALLSTCALPARADTVTIVSGRDATLYSENGTLANGAGDHYHCHILEHEDHEMMRQFETIESSVPTETPADGCGCGAGGGLDLAAVGGILLALLRPARLNSRT